MKESGPNTSDQFGTSFKRSVRPYQILTSIVFLCGFVLLLGTASVNHSLLAAAELTRRQHAFHLVVFFDYIMATICFFLSATCFAMLVVNLTNAEYRKVARSNVNELLISSIENLKRGPKGP